MIKEIINTLNIELSKLNYFDINYGLVEVTGVNGKIAPRKYCGNGEWKTLLDFDKSKGISYIRINGRVSQNEISQKSVGCDKLINVSIPIKLVCMFKREYAISDDEYSLIEIIEHVRKKILSTDFSALKSVIKAKKITLSVGTSSYNSKDVFKTEFGATTESELSYKYIIGDIDINISIVASNKCLQDYCVSGNECDNLFNALSNDDKYNCILKKYDFSSDIVINNLTTQQVTDIRNTFCVAVYVNVRKSNGDLISSVLAPANYNVSDSIITLQDTALNIISVNNVMATDPLTLIAPDAVYRNDSISPTFTQNIRSGQTYTAPNITLTQPNGVVENKLPNQNLLCTQINSLLEADLIAQLTQGQIVGVYNGRITINVLTYVSNGVYTKPSNLLYAHVIAIGGGGGGSSGAKRANGVASGGGGGGGCGAVVRSILPASAIAATEIVTIGAGGAGGAAVATNDTAQNGGGNGGATSFGSLVIATGGLGGVNASNGAGVNTSFNINTPNTNDSIIGMGGASGGTTGAGVSGIVWSFNTVGMYSGGGGGGAISAATPGTANTGGARCRIFNHLNVLSAAQAGGAAGGGDGANGLDNYALQIGLHDIILHTIGLGVSGCGGGSNNSGTGNGGNGGNGGLYGSGGGGGGACRNGTAVSGKGGNGAQGALIIYEFLIS